MHDVVSPAAAGRLAGEVVVVTGGAQGIGRAIAALAAREGAAVAALDLAGPIDEYAAAMAGEGLTPLVADVTDAAAVDAAVASVRSRLGRPTVLINNAGRNSYADPTAMTEQQWDAFFDLDLKSSWLCAKAVLPDMIAARSGSIVTVASIHASLTSKGMFPYAAAKSGLVGLTRSLALEVAEHGIRVNAVSPGYVGTRLVSEYLERSHPDELADVLAAQPLHRLGTPEEIAQVVCFLASSAASFVTGANWAVDGGFGVRFG